jgi:signal transduction histidine kinase/CheY-like chemotaxis protein
MTAEGQDTFIGVAGTCLETLINHDFQVASTATLESVYHLFCRQSYEYAGVVDANGHLEGVISRSRLGFLLGARFGFAVYGRNCVLQHAMPNALTFCTGTPLEDVLKAALARSGDSFYDDVALVATDGCYRGMISMQTLVRLQYQLVEERTALAEKRQRELGQKNLALEESLAALRKSRGQFGILFENSALAVALLTPDGRVTAGNHHLWNLLSESGNEHEPERLLSLMPEPERVNFLNVVMALVRSLELDQKAELEVTVETPHRGQRRLLLYLSWIKETSQVCLLVDDVTEQRLLERRMIQQEKSVLMENLAGGVAHEINNKLVPIVGFTELIQRELNRHSAPVQLVRYCQMVHDSAVESAQIIRQLLQLSRPGPIERASTDLRQICQEALTMLGFRIRQMDCQVRLEFPAHPVMVLAEPGQIKQVVMNLGLNALDAMEKVPSATLTLQARLEGSLVRFSVIDCGHGIAPENLARIFNPFFTTKGPDKGTGLGLSVCDSIIRQHGGEIHVTSTVGRGTAFSFTLPLALEPMAAALPILPFANSPAMEENPGRRVLLADDEESVTQMVEATLTSLLGYRVDRAANGQEAIERLQVQGYDLIISDVRMPLVDGLGVYRWLKENNPEQTKTFLFITGDAGSRELNEELERLGAPVLKKPFGIAHLVEHCRELTGGDETRRLIPLQPASAHFS